MFCKKCGKQINNGDQFCQFCGEPIVQEKKKIDKKTLITIIIVVAVVVVIIAGGITAGLLYANHKANTENDTSTTDTEETQYVDNEALESLLSAQPMTITGTQYLFANTSNLQYDAISATVSNSSDVSISSFVVAFCAWDIDGNPIQITQPEEQQQAAYVRTMSYDFSTSTNGQTSLAPGQTFDDVAIYVSSDPQIVTIKACVKSYISTDGITWENPYYNNFKNNYAGKTLTQSDAQTADATTDTTTTQAETTVTESTTVLPPNATTLAPSTSESTTVENVDTGN